MREIIRFRNLGNIIEFSDPLAYLPLTARLWDTRDGASCCDSVCVTVLVSIYIRRDSYFGVQGDDKISYSRFRTR